MALDFVVKAIDTAARRRSLRLEAKVFWGPWFRPMTSEGNYR
jgi:hypothetical protein